MSLSNTLEIAVQGWHRALCSGQKWTVLYRKYFGNPDSKWAAVPMFNSSVWSWLQ